MLSKYFNYLGLIVRDLEPRVRPFDFDDFETFTTKSWVLNQLTTSFNLLQASYTEKGTAQSSEIKKWKFMPRIRL